MLFMKVLFDKLTMYSEVASYCMTQLKLQIDLSTFYTQIGVLTTTSSAADPISKFMLFHLL